MIRRLCVCFLTVFSAAAQTQFDVASVKPSAPIGDWNPPIKESNAGRVSYRNYPLRRLIAEAYELGDYQIQGPAWLARERFDVIANKPRGATAPQLRQMMQLLLSQRFRLTTHIETKEMPGYALLPGKDTSKLRPEKDAPDVPGCQSFGTLTEFAEILSRQLESPVIDRTGIPGSFYFILAWSPMAPPRGQTPGDAPPPPPVAPPPCPGWSAATMPPLADSIFSAVRDQMGLRLERQGKAAVSVLVVDRAERVPEKN